jgi:hypothetical protein
MKAPDKQLGIKVSSCHRLGVKSRASTKFIERIGKHPDGWDLVKKLSQRMAEVHEIKQADLRHPSPLYFEAIAITGYLINLLLNPTIWLPLILIRPDIPRGSH